ncbi:hypothetical protein M413DRAFT_442140 [Hebeloma cylindrosporum]|uniref:Uncharacterized protein n=1 Tax=Hebeloma cylindrosporum TaxID=76867 RepID=A0A0C2YWU3_HEBCY|nr:hypothetical protein M413DRAFT_442140 [Hebeloma cylindrosporum h7]
MKRQSAPSEPKRKSKRLQEPRKSSKTLATSSAEVELPPSNAVSQKPSKRTKHSSEDTQSPEAGAKAQDKPELSEYSSVTDATAHFSRRERLIALSQTCRNLRRFLRPYVWCRIEVLDRMIPTTVQSVMDAEPRLALELVRQLEIVTVRDPSLAEYVKVVNVMIGNHCIRDVLRELARCLALFPNLEVFRMDHIKRGPYRRKLHINQAITYGFDRYKSFPQIRSVRIPRSCYIMQKYFPNAQMFWLNG